MKSIFAVLAFALLVSGLELRVTIDSAPQAGEYQATEWCTNTEEAAPEKQPTCEEYCEYCAEHCYSIFNGGFQSLNQSMCEWEGQVVKAANLALESINSQLELCVTSQVKPKEECEADAEKQRKAIDDGMQEIRREMREFYDDALGNLCDAYEECLKSACHDTRG